VDTTYHYVNSFRKHSRYNVSYFDINARPERPVDFSGYDAVWVNYCARLAFPDYQWEIVKQSVIAYQGPKLVAIQDEYDNTYELRNEIRRLGFDVVLTCIPQTSIEYAYPRAMFPATQFETVLTGYVAEGIPLPDLRPLAERPIAIGYRGRESPFRYGDPVQHKAEIGRRFLQFCRDRGTKVDIAVKEEARIYGRRWFEFMASCRAVLGIESGSNVFDFDGSLYRQELEMRAANPNLTYEQFRPLIEQRQGKIAMGQISPRAFEATALRTALVLMRGRYSDILKPDVHYIPVEPDYSNLDEVMQRIADVSGLQAMADRAYSDLIASGKYSYTAFVGRMDTIIDGVIAKKQFVRATPGAELIDLVSKRPLGRDPFLRRRVQELQAQIDLLRTYQAGFIERWERRLLRLLTSMMGKR
jgi:hypothetical protein